MTTKQANYIVGLTYNLRVRPLAERMAMFDRLPKKYMNWYASGASAKHLPAFQHSECSVIIGLLQGIPNCTKEASSKQIGYLRGLFTKFMELQEESRVQFVERLPLQLVRARAIDVSFTKLDISAKVASRMIDDMRDILHEARVEAQEPAHVENTWARNADWAVDPDEVMDFDDGDTFSYGDR